MREARRRDTVGAIHELPLQSGGESPEQDPSLPPGWVWTKVGALYEIVGGGTPSTKVDHFWVGDIPWITSADIHGPKDIRPRRCINLRAVDESATNLVPEGSIIVVTRVGLGKVALTETPICFSQDAQALVSGLRGALPDYALYYLSQATQVFKYRHRGTTIAGVTKKQLSDLGFPLAPLPEQRRIVAKIEELFSQLDAGVEALQKVKAQLQRYRQAVLKHAFEGKLTAEWREAHTDELEPASALLARIQAEREEVERVGTGRRKRRRKLPPLDTSALPEMPVSWLWARVGDVIRIIDYRGRTPPYSARGIPHLRTSNVKRGQIVWDDLKYISEETYEQYMTRGLPRKGDLLFTTEAPMGEVAVAPGERFSVAQRLMILRPLRAVLDSRFALYQIMSERFQRRLKYRGTGSTVTGVSLRNFRPQELVIASLEEQKIIVQEIERRLSIVDEIEQALCSGLARAERLRQSILKRAFEGRLVPQDPSDEPAWKLLERIKAEKGRQENTKKAGGRGKRKRSPEATQGRLL